MNKHEESGREYEKSGMYTKEGKSFRLIALLVGLTAVVAFMAIAAALLNMILL